MILSDEQLRLVRKGADAVILKRSDSLKADRVVSLSRRLEDGGRRPVVRNVEGDEFREVATVFKVEDRYYDDLSFADAKACGYRTTDDLKAAWRAAHPVMPEIALVTLKIGDYLDRYRGLKAQMGSISDYTTIPSQSAWEAGEALHPAEYAALGMAAKQTQAARKAASAKALSSRPLQVRIQHFEAVRDELGVKLGRELRVITDRLEQAEKRAREIAA